jgi:hypothetical protein
MQLTRSPETIAMPDPTISEAIAEAYASNPVGSVIWETMELWHPAWTDPLYIVGDRLPLDARIEATAERNAGAAVTFVPWSFTFVPPDMSQQSLPQATIDIDNVSREIGRQLDLAILDGRPIKVIWRTYLSGRQMEGPEHLPPIKMELKTVNMSVMSIRATLGFRDLLNATFPSLEYDSDHFPGLAA